MVIKRVLVAGGAGFIGTNFVRWTRQHFPHVYITVLDSFTYAGQGKNFYEDGWIDAADNSAACEVVRGDVCDTAIVDTLVSQADVIINFAAESHNDVSLHAPRTVVETNTLGVCVLLEAVRAHNKRLVQVSTDEVFGDLSFTQPAFTAESPYRPSSPYSASKASADLLLGAWVRSFGLDGVISVSTNNYGPFQHPEKFIPRQITELLSGRPARLYGSGRHVRDWIHVDDHCAALWKILMYGKPGQRYLVGAHNEISNYDVVQGLLTIFGLPKDSYIHVADRAGHDIRYALDSSRTRDELGWQPQHLDFMSELETVVGWYDAHRSWWAKAKESSEKLYQKTGQ
ncbi:dTDP-glucose 4,6-dehydratase [Timonella sp. A28]|uniref:dTDP-glucose 4,6-dehydratase n=1 Tax=Timonella sp. A28 TaxID=3442640 RepID=UPI003EBEDB48